MANVWGIAIEIYHQCCCKIFDLKISCPFLVFFFFFGPPNVSRHEVELPSQLSGKDMTSKDMTNKDMTSKDMTSKLATVSAAPPRFIYICGILIAFLPIFARSPPPISGVRLAVFLKNGETYSLN